MGERMKKRKKRRKRNFGNREKFRVSSRERNAGVPSDEGEKREKQKREKKNRAFAPCLSEGGKRVLMGFRRVLGEKEKRESCVGIQGKKE